MDKDNIFIFGLWNYYDNIIQLWISSYASGEPIGQLTMYIYVSVCLTEPVGVLTDRKLSSLVILCSCILPLKCWDRLMKVNQRPAYPGLFMS